MWRRVLERRVIERAIDPAPEPTIVEELYSAPHIHEQMTTSYYGYDNIMLEHNAMNNMDTVAHMNVHNTQY